MCWIAIPKNLSQTPRQLSGRMTRTPRVMDLPEPMWIVGCTPLCNLMAQGLRIASRREGRIGLTLSLLRLSNDENQRKDFCADNVFRVGRVAQRILLGSQKNCLKNRIKNFGDRHKKTKSQGKAHHLAVASGANLAWGIFHLGGASSL